MKKLTLALIILIAILCTTLTACSLFCEHEFNKDDTCEKCGYQKIVTYTVTFDTNGGTSVDPQQVKKGQKATAPDTPTKDGYVFGGWYYGDEKWSFVGYVVTDNMTLTAKWIKGTTCTVAFLNEKGKVIAEYEVGIGATLTEIPSFTKENCTFLGWYRDGVLWDTESAVTGNLVLAPKLETSMYYIMDGGVNHEENPTKIYSDQSYPFTLYRPTKNGYTFEGWYTDSSFTNKITAITAFSTYTLYARWTYNGEVGGGDIGGDNGGGGGNDNGDNLPPENEGGYPWANTEIIFSINEDSDGGQLPSSAKRYLAGVLEGSDMADHSIIDNYVKARNDAATKYTGVSVNYQYLPDGGNYGWGNSIQYIYHGTSSGSPDAPDVYVNFVYDMVAASLKGSFANLYSTTMYGEGHEWSSSEYNYFAFEDNRNYTDNGTGYMYEYMRSLTLNKNKMYCLASDYFIDIVRAFYIVPVNIDMLNSIPASSVDGEANSDRNGNGVFDIDDLYELVWEGEWNYEALATLANAITSEDGYADGIGLDDTVGFALGTGSGVPASGMLYTTSIPIINRYYEYDTGDYSYSYPNVMQTIPGQFAFSYDSYDRTYDQLDVFCKNLSTLVNQDGVITVSSHDATQMGYASDTDAIRKKFANNTLLFGGVILLGGLEHQDYLDMKGEGKKGYGILPVPLYHSDGGDVYLTSIHNNAKIGAISLKTKKFAQCTAYLNYQSLNSNKVLNEYYNHKLRQTVQVSGTDRNREMLNYLRIYVRNTFDKTFEDAIGAHFSAQTDGESSAIKWHNIIKDANFSVTDMRSLYPHYAPIKAQYLDILTNTVYAQLPD